MTTRNKGREDSECDLRSSDARKENAVNAMNREGEREEPKGSFFLKIVAFSGSIVSFIMVIQFEQSTSKKQ